MTAARLGVIGGSGLYTIDGLADAETVALETPFGSPSSSIIVGRIGGESVAFLARHGDGHALLPTEINYRANIYAMKLLGVEFLVSASSVGSLREDIRPLDVVVPDQFIDRTRHRNDTFFGAGLVAHVSMADPVCSVLSAEACRASESAGARVHHAGTYICMEGPQFSTRAESNLYRSWGATVIGMTNLQEARLAREAEICYASLAFVTDYDCWKTDEVPVTVDAVIDRLHRNAETAKAIIVDVAGRLPSERSCSCATVLDSAIITREDVIPRETRDTLHPLIARVFSR